MTNNGANSAEQFWEGHYRQRDKIWSGRANPVLVATVEALPAGTALDLGCGEGGDAVWLARHGWQVTAVDVSTTALARTVTHAVAAGVGDRVEVAHHDLPASFPDGVFDLVSAQFMQSPIEFPREQVLRRAAAAVAPGGLLLIVEHAAAPPWAAHAHEDMHFPTPHETVAALDLAVEEWRTERAEVAERQATGPSGEDVTLRDGVIAIRRR